MNDNHEFSFVKLIFNDKGDYMLLQLNINDHTITLVKSPQL